MINVLKKMENLTELTISGNWTPIIPQDIGDLVNLKKLVIRLNEMLKYNDVVGQHIPVTIFSLIQLEELDIPRSIILLREPAIDFPRLINLKKLDHSGSPTVNLKSIVKLTNLTYLNLSSCGLTDISGMGNLINLTHLDLACNKLHSLSEIENLKNLAILDLTDNPLKNVPKKIRDIPNIHIKGFSSPIRNSIEWIMGHEMSPQIAQIVVLVTKIALNTLWAFAALTLAKFVSPFLATSLRTAPFYLQCALSIIFLGQIAAVNIAYSDDRFLH